MGSRFPVGSSASRISGRLTKARAMATRCCSPPESSWGRLSRFLARPDQLEHLGHLGGDDVLGPADDLEGEGHVLEHRLVGQQAEVLEHAADVAAQVGDPPLGQMADLLARLPDPSRIGHLLPQEEPDEGRLPRARRADQEDELALFDLDGEVSEGDGRALVRLGDVLEFDHRE